MKRALSLLPLLALLPPLATVAVILLMAWHGPIAQLPHYHDFADTQPSLGIPNAADVLSNFTFALAALFGLRAATSGRLGAGAPGYLLFMIALLLTAAGSAYYHLQPDDARLVWDRIPIALASAGLLCAVHAETHGSRYALCNVLLLAAGAVGSVLWWKQTGDLRFYLLLQILPLILIPLWQHLHGTARGDRAAFGLAIMLYVLAKLAELGDHQILLLTGCVSGHTLKHALAAAAAAAITVRLRRRARPFAADATGRALAA